MTLSDLERLSEIFSDTKHCAASLCDTTAEVLVIEVGRQFCVNITLGHGALNPTERKISDSGFCAFIAETEPKWL